MNAMKKCRALLWCVFLLFAATSAEAAESRVIVSIKPLHSLVSAIMAGTGTPELLVGGMQSPHGYQLKPSQVEALHHAAVVFYIGPDLETFLARPLETVSASVRRVALVDAPGVAILQTRSGGAWEPDEESGDPARDPHIWLDTGNAKAMTRKIAGILKELYPENAAVYDANEAALVARLDKLKAELDAQLEPVKGKPFIVFHDAYQYFEHDYGLAGAGAITLEPDQEPGARRISEIRGKIKSADVRCVFAEPQFNEHLVQTVTEGLAVKAGVLDPLGADIPEGPELYFTLLRKMAGHFKACLGS